MRKRILLALCCISTISAFLFTGCEQHECTYVPTVTDPTCIAQGYTTYTCECGNSYVDNYTPATGVHTYGEWQPTTPATCTQEGEEIRYCINDGCSDQQTQPIAKLSHVYLPEVYSPTCSGNGYTKYTCGCGDTYTETDQNTILMHNFNSSRVCTGCNKHVDDVDYVKYTSGSSAFYLVNNGSYNYDLYVFGSGSIIYPSSMSNWYNNRKYIKRVWMADGITNLPTNGGIFAFFSTLHTVRLPETLLDIPTNTFSQCYALKSLTIPSSVKTMSYAFGGCDALEKVVINDVESWCNISFAGDDANPLYYAKHLYLGDEEITDLVIPNTITEIKKYAFVNGAFTSVNLPSNLTTISDYAFYGCKNLQSINIPSSVTSYGDSVLTGCNNISYTEYEGGSYLGNSDNEYLVFVKPISESTDTLTLNSNVKIIASGAFTNSAITSITIPSAIKHVNNGTFEGCSALQTVTIENGVESLGDEVFRGCTQLVSVSIPNSVTQVGISLFSNCSNLQAVSFGTGITEIPSYFFSNCTNLKEIELPDSITVIDATAFAGCANLQSISLGNGIETIGNSMFEGFASLTSVTIGNNVKSIGENAFSGTSLTTVTIPDSVVVIGNNAFSPDVNDNQTSVLKTVIIGNGVKHIDAKAFLNCENLESVTFGNNLLSIGDSAFSGCSKLDNVTMPDSLITIGNGAFSSCIALSSINVGTGVKTIGNEAFYGCSKASAVTIPDSVETIGYEAFESCGGLVTVELGAGVKSLGTGVFSFCYKLEKVIVGDNIISVGRDIFEFASKITFNEYEGGCYLGDETNKYKIFIKPTEETVTSIALHANTKVIAGYAFGYCDALKTVEIPEGVVSIGEYAFYQCQALTGVTIPDSVVSIGRNAFNNCKLLATAIIGNGVKEVGDGAFNNCTKLTFNKTNNGCYLGNDSNKYLVFIKPTFETTATTTSISLHSNTKVMAGASLSGYSKLTSVTLNEGLLSIGASAFSECKAIINLTIPSTVTSIGASAFFRLRALRYVTFRTESQLKEIGEGAFYQCDELDEIIIPDSVEVIGANCFEACSDLAKVTIGSGVKYIGANAFLSSLNSNMLTNFTFKTPQGWWYNESALSNYGTTVSFEGLTSSALRVYFLTSHVGKTWQRA